MNLVNNFSLFIYDIRLKKLNHDVRFQKLAIIKLFPYEKFRALTPLKVPSKVTFRKPQVSRKSHVLSSIRPSEFQRSSTHGVGIRQPTHRQT